MRKEFWMRDKNEEIKKEEGEMGKVLCSIRTIWKTSSWVVTKVYVYSCSPPRVKVQLETNYKSWTIDSTFYEPKRSSVQYSNNRHNVTFWMTTLFSWRVHSKLSKALYSHQSASRSMAQTEAKKVSNHKSAFPRNLQGSSIHLIRIYFKLGYS